MKRSALAALVLLSVPTAAAGQLEVGIDAGVTFNTGFDVGDDVTQISIPAGWARLGVPVGEMLSVEGLFGFERISSDGESFSVLSFVPGLNLAIGASGFYVRGEVAVTRAAFDDESQSQFGLGAAVGLKKAIDDGPVSFRIEGGFDRWLEDEEEFQEAYSQIRFLVGISATVGG